MRQQTSCSSTTSPHASKLHVRDQTISTVLYQTKEPENKDSSDNQRQFSSLPRLYTGPSVHGIFRSTETKTSVPTLGEGVKVQLTPDQSHYVSNVMRLFKKGKKKAEKRVIADGDTCTVDVSQCVRIFDGKNGEWLARVSAIQHDVQEDENQQQQQQQQQQHRRKRKRDTTPSLYAECLHQLRTQETRQSPWVFFAPIKKHRAKLMIEKCTELGAGKFVPIITERTDSSAVSACIGSSGSSRGKDGGMQSFEGLEKLVIQALEASEQCERLSVPCVLPSAVPTGNKDNLWDTEALLKNWCNNDASVAQNRILLICRERRSEDTCTILSTRLRDGGYADGVAFLIGPEGGWSPEEEALFDQYQEDAPLLVQGVSLGSYVLRAETAAITCVAACNLHHAESNAS